MKTQTSWTKRIVALLLAMTMVIGMVGCGKRAETDAEAGKKPVGETSDSKLPTDYDREDMELIVDLVGNGQPTDGLSDKELGDLVEDLIGNMGDSSSNATNLGSSTEVEKPEAGWEKDESAYDENGAITKPFDQIYPELIENGSVKFSDEQLLIKLKSGKLTDGLMAAGVAALEEIVPMGDCAWYVAKLIDGTDAKEALAAVRELEEVMLAEYDYQMKAAADGAANIKEQWHLNAKEYGISEAEEYLSEKEGSIPGGASSVIVAVIDTGVDYDHQDLKDNMWINTKEIPDNGIDDDGNGYTDDYYGVNIVNRYNGGGNGDDDHGHGTHVAGIIAAQNNNLGVTGIAYNVQIMAIKAGNHSGYFNDSDVAAAILYAFTHGAEVINMSFGGSSCSMMVQDALAMAYSRCVLVASAGNSGRPNEEIMPFVPYMPNYPAALSYVMGVMSVARYNSVYGNVVSLFSNWDVNAYNSVEYEVAAPGEAIMSTLPNDQYGSMDGTSMAAPVVSAMAAILRSEYSDRDVYPTKFIYGQLASTSETKATCNNPKEHKLPTGKPHALPQVVNLYDALTKLPKPDVQLNDSLFFDSEELLYNEDALKDVDKSVLSKKNNGDGVIDAGETFALGLYLQNRWGASADTMVTIDTYSKVTGEDNLIADPYITIHNPTVNYGGVGTYSIADSGKITDDDLMVGWEKPFLITVADNCPNDYIFNLNVTIECKNGLDEEDTDTYTTTGTVTLTVRNGVVLPSIIEEDMVLTADNLYIIPNYAYIQEGVTVRVMPGTRIQFWSHDPGDPYAEDYIAFLSVGGRFLVEGTKDNPVYLFPSDLMNRYSVVINSNDTGYVSIKYADITNGFSGNVDYVEGCTFRQSYATGLRYRYRDGTIVRDQVYYSTPSVWSLTEAKDCVFYKLNGGVGGRVFDRCVFVGCSGGGTVTRNCVYTSGGSKAAEYTEPEEYLEKQEGNWKAAFVYYNADTGTTYIVSHADNFGNSFIGLNTRYDGEHIKVDYIRAALGGDYAIIETEEELAWLRDNVFERQGWGTEVYDIGIRYDAEQEKHVWHNGTAVPDFVDTTGLTESAAAKAYLLYLNEDENGNEVKALVTAPTKDSSQGYMLYEIPGEILPTEITLHDYEITLDLGTETVDTPTYQIVPESLPVTLPLEMYSYKSSDEQVVQVSATGVITPVGKGEADVVVSSRDGAVWNYITVKVEEYVGLEEIQLEADSAELAVGKEMETIVTLLPENTTRRAVTYTSSHPEAVKVDQFGRLTAVGSGTATITATCDGKEASVEVTAYVKAGSLKLDTTGFVAVYKGEENNTVDLPAVITPEGSEPKFSWRSTNTEVAHVDRMTGKLVLNGKGTTTLIVEDVRSGLSDSCLVIVQGEEPVGIKDVKAPYDSSQYSKYGVLTEDGKLYAWKADELIPTPQLVAENVVAFTTANAMYNDATYITLEKNADGESQYYQYYFYDDYDNNLQQRVWRSTKRETDLSILQGETIIAYKSGGSGSSYNYFVFTESGKTYAWGSVNNRGQLGVGTTVTETSPKLVPMANIVDVVATLNETWFLTKEGRLYQTGTIDGGFVSTPILRAEDVVSMAVDGNCYALMKDGRICSISCLTGAVSGGVDYSAYEPVKALFRSTSDGAFIGEDGSAYYVKSYTVTKLDIENAVALYGTGYTYYFVTEENLVYGVGNNYQNQLAGATAVEDVKEAVLVPLFGLPTDRLKVKDNLTMITETVDEQAVTRYELQAHFTDKLVLRFNHPITFANVMLYERVGDEESEFQLSYYAEKAIVNQTDLEVWMTNGFLEKTGLDYPITYRLVIPVDGVSTKLGLTNDTEITLEFTFVGREKEVEISKKEDRVIHESVTDLEVERILTAEKVLELICEYEQETHVNPTFYGNAVLNPYQTSVDLSEWARLVAPSITLGEYKEVHLGGNWWGTDNSKLIDLMVLDYSDYPGYARLHYDPYLLIPENTFPFVTSVRLLNAKGEEVSTVGNEEVTFVVTFNRDMDTTMPLSVSFGSAYPYADYAVEGKYIDARTWQGTYTLRTIIENGQQYIKVSNGRAIVEDAADGYLELFADEGHHGFTIDTSAAQALIMQGEAMDTCIRLWWMQDDFDTLLGYNIYRSEYETGYYSRINSVSIPADTKEFFDNTVEPGKVYYYYFTVIKTDLTESEPSGRITLMSKDTMAPNIYHSPVNLATMAQNLIISASVTDNLSIAYAELYYRTAGAEEWKLCRMNALNDRYSAIIPADQLSTEGLEYYIVAYDGVSYTYCGSAETPYFVQVQQALDKNALGDVDGDGVITNRDALLLLQHISGKVYLTAEQFARADLNQDNALHAVEALRILKYISGEVGSLDMSGEVLQ